MADKRTTNMCLGFAIHFLIIFFAELVFVHHRCTFSFACTLSYIYLPPKYSEVITEYLYLNWFFVVTIYLILPNNGRVVIAWNLFLWPIASFGEFLIQE